MKRKLFLLALTASGLIAQTNLGTYLGPGILSRGIGDIGMRGSEQVEIRPWIGVEGLFDNGLAQTVTTTESGNLINSRALYGVGLAGGIYGVHSWKRAQLGIDYTGRLSHYTNASGYDGTTHNFTLGYSYQATPHTVFDFRQTALVYSQAAEAPLNNGSVTDPATGVVAPLTNERSTFLSSSASATFIQSARLSYTFGGGGRISWLDGPLTQEMAGANAVGAVTYRLNERDTVGATYSFMHDFTRDGGYVSDVHVMQAQYQHAFGPLWTLRLSAGAFFTHVDQTISIPLDPFLAALFGVRFLAIPVQTSNLFPSGSAQLERRFRRTMVSIAYSRATLGGNGYFMTSRSETFSGSASYTGIRRIAVSVSGEYQNDHAIGQQLSDYAFSGGTANFSYRITNPIQFYVRADYRYTDYASAAGYQRSYWRAAMGISFSPGTLPLSLW